MGRKSIAEQRRQQILTAFYQCVSQHGLAKSSLQLTATSAGLEKHQLLHYFGNRQALVMAAVEGMIERYQQRIAEQMSHLKGQQTQQQSLAGFLDWLFLGAFYDEQTDPLYAELLLLSRRDPQAGDLLKQAFTRLQQLIAQQIQALLPQHQADRCNDVAYLVLSISLGSCELECIGFDQGYRQVVRDQVATLLEVL